MTSSKRTTMITPRWTLTIPLHGRSRERNSVHSGGSRGRTPVSTRRVIVAAPAHGITDASLQLALPLAQSIGQYQRARVYSSLYIYINVYALMSSMSA